MKDIYVYIIAVFVIISIPIVFAIHERQQREKVTLTDGTTIMVNSTLSYNTGLTVLNMVDGHRRIIPTSRIEEIEEK
jgi:hypothetical protein